MKLEIKKGEKVSKKFIEIFDKAKQKNFGDKKLRDFSKYYKDTFFILKYKDKVVSFCQIKKIKINYNKKNYNILGIANVISLEKKKGYGKQLIGEVIKFTRKKDKTLLGFCKRKNKDFYKKIGIKINKKLCYQFLYNGKTNKYEDYAIYFEGKDKFISKILKSKKIIKLSIPFW